jgi:nucleotide-binding universal stress UspA family protein
VAVHTWHDSSLGPDVQAIGPMIDWAAVAADEQRVLAEALAGWRAERPDVEVREVVLRDRPAHGLISCAVTAELLVVGHRRHTRLGALRSTTHGVLHRAACPVAVVPVDAGPGR